MKSKSKTREVFVCADCGAEYVRWQGQCTACREWDTIKPMRVAPAASAVPAAAKGKVELGTLDDVAADEERRIATGIGELDRVLGGGLVPGSSLVLGGNPGAGKSTILLQVMCRLAERMTALYVSGEESLRQVAGRARRLGLPTNRLRVLGESDAEAICEVAAQEKPAIIVVDSIQVMQLPSVDSAPGGVTQVRETAAYLTRYAKATGTVLLMVGHVTKDNSLAGPMTLNHLIDTSIMMSSTEDARYRIMRATKNRFGPVNEVGVFAMTSTGLKEVKNPSAIFLSRAEEAMPGSLVTVLWEGTRPLLVEIQALVDGTQLANPRRLAVGVDQNRLSMLLAVAHRHAADMRTFDKDVFLNVVGGIRVAETSADLAVLLAAASSLRDKALPQDLVVFGEVGLSGEVRPVQNGQERIAEAAKHGFTKAIVPRANAPKSGLDGVRIAGVGKLGEALELLDEFGVPAA